ncbi:MAG: excinuclease ABC subunit UvrC [Coxiellaceae bacterium]|nr:excinuclease ABC subunit UvrC [Coxiellaceae bacterium]
MAFDHDTFLKVLSTQPGVYRMISSKGDIIYVGKARNLQKRVSQYFQKQHPLTKTSLMVAQIADVQVTITESEVDALILEATLIKRHRPKYNILLRDDKSYPYIYISTQNDFPQMDFVRGKKKKQGRYFGPYPSIGSARETLALLQKCFMLRQCKDSVFRHRSRPCLQYQIKRCQAPCVGYIDHDDYQQTVRQAIQFLEGKSESLIDEFIDQMKQASSEQNYERAGQIRDDVEKLRKLQHHQYFSHDQHDIDVIALVQTHHIWVVSVLLVRGGELLTHHCYYPKVPVDADETEVLLQFINHYYLNETVANLFPAKILLPFAIDKKDVIESAIKQHCDRKVHLMSRTDDVLKQWRAMAERNAKQALAEKLAGKTKIDRQLQGLAKAMGLSKALQRIECFDISHTQGEATKASCVVYDRQGACKKAYRQFDIKDVTPGDDYAAMRQAVYRRYAGLLKRGETLPDVVLIDGGTGQLKQADEVLQELQIDSITLLGVAKGKSRKPGLERLLLTSGQVLQLPPHSEAFHLIQFIRDESHRFGIRAHRNKRDKSRTQSVLEQIPGVGPKKRQALLAHFGGLQGLKQASAVEIAKVRGITLLVAEEIKRKLD